ncbi:MAG: aromatic ring-hydroxylating dioxygenase subunit alpha, partial [Gammaproteobacteria bacterium]|nr:aromatic ring-hydroxylating dioxygenase subunit alpha [Gammaproteobacteria bacterium]
VPNVGDWFLYELAGESVIIVRVAQDRFNALVNVCRHRGSRVCAEASGRSKRLACRYHGWVYGLDGELLAARYMGEEFDKSGIALKRLHCEVLGGMIFVNFADEPAPFDFVRQGLSECLAPYHLDSAKVAHRQSYPMNANWKLAVENYSECYHCAPAHPEYSRGHSLARPEKKTADLYEEILSRAPACGLSDKQVNRSLLNAEGFGADYNYERYPMIGGHLTGSDDGQQVAPLLGEIPDYYGGCTDFMVGPVTFALAYCDHVVIYAFKPLVLDRCDCDITWLVRGDAEESVDYDKDKLTWLWDITTHADKRIIERNAEGVNSRYYEPGPLSEMESFTWQFLEWYLDLMKRTD